MTEETFAVRCFLNRKRKLTHQLTRREAKNFRLAALYLASYLKREYKLTP